MREGTYLKEKKGASNVGDKWEERNEGKEDLRSGINNPLTQTMIQGMRINSLKQARDEIKRKGSIETAGED